MEFTVKVPVRVTAASEEEAIDLAQKQYGGKRPKKATVVEASLWPDALRPLIEKYGISAKSDLVRWGVVDGDTWCTNGEFAMLTNGILFAGEPYDKIGMMPRGQGNKPCRRGMRRLDVQIGESLVDRRYVDLIEEAHGACEWRSGQALDVVTAYQGDKWVGTIASLRDSITEYDAQNRLENARWDAKMAVEMLGKVDEIRKAVAALPDAVAAEAAAKSTWEMAMGVLSRARRLANEANALDGAEAKAAAAAKVIAECEAELRALGVAP